MKKLFRIIIALIPIAIGAIFILASINTALKDDIIFSWITPGLFGISLIVAGIAIIRGVKLEDIFTDYI